MVTKRLKTLDQIKCMDNVQVSTTGVIENDRWNDGIVSDMYHLFGRRVEVMKCGDNYRIHDISKNKHWNICKEWINEFTYIDDIFDKLIGDIND